MNEYHVPVLLEKSVEGLAINKKAAGFCRSDIWWRRSFRTYSGIDGADSILYSFDQDLDAVVNKIEDKRLILIETNFRYFRKFLRLYDIFKVDGILADLGVSSYQLDEKTRGFSYRVDQELDMRMSRDQEISAADVLNGYSEEDLIRVFRNMEK